MKSLSAKILTIGLDGADPRLLAKWLGSLPNIKQLSDNGMSGKLASVIPPISASAWTSFSTGLNPGRTGVFDFVSRRAEDYRLNVVRSTDIASKTIWEILSERGFCCGVMNVPVAAWPPQSVKGFVVSGLPDPSVTTHPPTLSEKIKQLGWRPDPPMVGKSAEDIRRELLSTMRSRGEVAKHLLEEYHPDFFLLVLTETDRAQHFLLSRNDEIVREVYAMADEIIGELREAYEPTVTVVLSDHGFNAIQGTFFTNCWLLEREFLALKSPLSDPVSFEEAPIAWNRTRAFSYGDQGKIYVNLVGREPQGTVKASDYSSVVSELESELSGLTDNGRRLHVKTWRAKEIYRGPWLSCAPDLVFQIERGEYGAKTSLGHRTVFQAPQIWSADHAIEGVYAIEGRGIPHAGLDASILDLAPTILHEYGVELPDLDGRALKTCIGAT